MAWFFRKVRLSEPDREHDLISAIRRHAEPMGRAGRDVEAVATDVIVARAACDLAEGTDIGPARLRYGEELGALHAVMGRRWPTVDRTAVAELTRETLEEAAGLATTATEQAAVAIRRGWLALARGRMQEAVDVTNVAVPRETDGEHPGRIMSLEVNIEEIRKAAMRHDPQHGLQAFRGGNLARRRDRQALGRGVG
jgi:hypothetical protein